MKLHSRLGKKKACLMLLAKATGRRGKITRNEAREISVNSLETVVDSASQHKPGSKGKGKVSSKKGARKSAQWP